MNASPVWRWWLAALLGSAGCGRHAQPDLADAHALPPHHPRTFHRAVAVLDSDGLTSAERLDVIRWLPELAADTTLSRERWEQVTRLSAALAAAAPHGPAADAPLAALRAIDAELPDDEGGHSEPATGGVSRDARTTGSMP
jgi:hypothetical protein